MAKSKQEEPEKPDEGAPDSRGELDAFVLRDVFPDPHDLLAFQRGSVESAIKIGFFALDTSALLKAYGLSDSSLAGVGAIYRDLVEARRLVVPSHALREFAHRRPERIKQLYQQVSDARRGTLRTTLAGFDQFPEHAMIVQLENEIADHIAERDKLLGKMLETIASWKGDDPVNRLYRELFTEDVVVEPAVEVETLKQDVERRFKNRIPPGFKDARKNTNASGDVLIWHSILAAGARLKRPAIVVSGEQKTDWFCRSKGVPLFERVELIDEYRRASSGRQLHIITFEEFLRLMNADAEVVKEVQRSRVTRTATERPRGHWGYLAERAVMRWLRSNGWEVIETDAFPDFVAYREGDDTARHIEVRLASNRPLAVAKANDVLARAEAEKIDSLTIVFVALSQDHADRALGNLHRFFRKNPQRIADTRVIVGFLDDENADFTPTGEVLERSFELT